MQSQQNQFSVDHPSRLWGLAFGAQRVVAAIALGLVLGACTKPPEVQEPVRAVRVFAVGIEKMQSGAEFAAEVKARIETKYAFRVPGKIAVRAVEPGQRVKAGQLLAQLDAQDYLLAAEAAKAQVSAAATNRNIAAAEFKRFSELKEQQFVSGAELDRRDAALKSAEAQLEQAQSQLASQRNQTGYTKLVADVSGIVVGVDGEAGQVVPAGQVVVRIAKDGPRDIVFAVPEDKVALIEMKSAVRVRSWSDNTSFGASVREIGATADPTTRTFQIKAGVEGADAMPAIGTTVYAIPQVYERKDIAVIKVPTSALKQDGISSAVWVLDPKSMTLKSQAVEILTADGNEAVISKGLQPGMQIVSAGVHVLKNGEKVTIYKDRSAPAKNLGGSVAVGAGVAKGSAEPTGRK